MLVELINFPIYGLLSQKLWKACSQLFPLSNSWAADTFWNTEDCLLWETGDSDFARGREWLGCCYRISLSLNEGLMDGYFFFFWYTYGHPREKKRPNEEEKKSLSKLTLHGFPNWKDKKSFLSFSLHNSVLYCVFLHEPPLRGTPKRCVKERKRMWEAYLNTW